MNKADSSPRVILASTSPRRREILALLGIPFQVVDPEVEETPLPGKQALETAVHWALNKAEAVAADFQDALVIGGDTLIELGGEKIGKPRNAREAAEILQRLSGKTHQVLSAVAGIGPGAYRRTKAETVKVRMRLFSEAEIIEYIRSGEPMDKAGAYSIQGGGAHLIEAIEGDYLAAVGLPLRAVAGILREGGITLRVEPEKIYAERSFLNWRDFASPQPHSQKD